VRQLIFGVMPVDCHGGIDIDIVLTVMGLVDFILLYATNVNAKAYL
jgi:hypothetical protein